MSFVDAAQMLDDVQAESVYNALIALSGIGARLRVNINDSIHVRQHDDDQIEIFSGNADGTFSRGNSEWHADLDEFATAYDLD